MPPLYSVGTWDIDRQAYTPQTRPWANMSLAQLRRALKQLRKHGYTCHRYRDEDRAHRDTDPFVLVERTDGEAPTKILERWKRGI